MDSGKADIAAQFQSVCKNVKPETVSAGKSVNRLGAVQDRPPAFPRTQATAEARLLPGEAEKRDQVSQGCREARGFLWRLRVVNGPVSSKHWAGIWQPLKGPDMRLQGCLH